MIQRLQKSKLSSIFAPVILRGPQASDVTERLLGRDNTCSCPPLYHQSSTLVAMGGTTEKPLRIAFIHPDLGIGKLRLYCLLGLDANF